MSYEIRTGSKSLGSYKTLGGAKSAARARSLSTGSECFVFEIKRGQRARRVGSYAGRTWKAAGQAPQVQSKPDQADRKNRKKADKKGYAPKVNLTLT